MGAKDPASSARPGEPPPFACRTCGKPATPGSKSFPFCCDRCRWVDLGQWMTESYRIPDRGPIVDTSDEPDAGDPGSQDGE